MIDISARGGREPRHVPERDGDPRNRIVTVVPRPCTLVKPMVPPQLSTSRRAIASPRPDPLEVVENAGSKTCGRTSGAMPRPSSSTASPQPSSETRTVTRRAPALRAVSSRLMRTSLTSSRPAEAGARWRCWIPSRIGVRGFLISCATCRAISPQASTRAARVRAVASSSATTQPSGAGPRDASCTRIWRPPTANSRSTMPSVLPSRNSRTASQTTSHSAGAARGSRSPGARGAPSSSAARGFTRGESRQIYGGHEPRQRREDEREREVLLLLPHALVVQQLRGGQDLLALRRLRAYDQVPDANRAAGRAAVSGELELVSE